MSPAAPSEPFPERIAPMLAKAGSLPAADPGRWAFELKWDGVRALAHLDGAGIVIRSRRGTDVTARYPELAGLGEALGARAAVFDGEIVARDAEGRPSFQLLQRRMGLGSETAARARMAATPVDYIVFDLLHLDGANVRRLPYSERRELLAGLELDGPSWSSPAHRLGGGGELLEAARASGLEGVVAKRLDSPYREGRRLGEWVKERLWRRQEFVIGGHLPGEGRRRDRVGSLLVGYYDARASELGRGERQRLSFAGAVGSGLSEEQIKLLTVELAARGRSDSPFDDGGPGGPRERLARFCEPELVCEVAWSEWTAAGTLRQPAFKGMRPDSDPREVVREN